MRNLSPLPPLLKTVSVTKSVVLLFLQRWYDVVTGQGRESVSRRSGLSLLQHSVATQVHPLHNPAAQTFVRFHEFTESPN